VGMESQGAGMIRVRVIGECVIETPRGRVTPTAEVFFSLLLVLAVERGRRVTRERLLELFWAGEPDAQARHNLRQLLYKATKRYGVPLQTEVGAVSWSADAVHLDIEDGIDSVEWARMTAPGATLGVLLGVPPAGGYALQEWLDRLRTRGEGIVRERLLRGVGTAREASDWEVVERLSRHCLALDPLNEEATLALAESLALSGSKAKAVRLLSDYEEEVGGGESVLALPARVLRRRIAERLPSNDADPVASIPLFERRTQMAELGALVASLSQSMRGFRAMITGPSGAGKSKLANETARNCAMRGVRVVSLRSSPSPEHSTSVLTEQLAHALLTLRGSLGASPASYQITKALVGSDDKHATAAIHLNDEHIASCLLDVLIASTTEGPVALIIDDLPSCDSTIRQLVHRLCLDTPHSNLGLVVCSAIIDNGLSLHNWQLITARPLSEGATVEMLRSLLDGVALAVDPGMAITLTGGLPIRILALARALRTGHSLSSAADTLEEIATQRIGTLTSLELTVLATASLLAPTGTASDLADILSETTPTLADAVSKLVAERMLAIDSNLQLDVHAFWTTALRRAVDRATLGIIAKRVSDHLLKDTRCSLDRTWRASAALALAGDTTAQAQLIETMGTELTRRGQAAGAVMLYDAACHLPLTALDTTRFRIRQCLALSSTGDWLSYTRSRMVIHPELPQTFSPRSALELELSIADLAAELALSPGTPEAPLRALRLAETASTDTHWRSQLIRFAFMSADNWCLSDYINKAADALAALPRHTLPGTEQLQCSILLAHSQHDYATATLACRQLTKDYLTARDMRSASRAARWAARSLRLAGKLPDALGAAQHAVDLARLGNDIVLEARALDTAACIHIELGQADHASALLETIARSGLLTLPAMVSVDYSETLARLHYVCGRYKLCEDVALTALQSKPSDVNPRVRALLLSWVLLAQLKSARKQEAAQSLQLLLALWDDRISAVGGLDPVAGAIAFALSALDTEDASASFRLQYLNHVRIAKGTMHWLG
jgi:DNA-binding SARP family transcriptional activator